MLATYGTGALFGALGTGLSLLGLFVLVILILVVLRIVGLI